MVTPQLNNDREQAQCHSSDHKRSFHLNAARVIGKKREMSKPKWGYASTHIYVEAERFCVNAVRVRTQRTDLNLVLGA
jgi:hypothetical protein